MTEPKLGGDAYLAAGVDPRRREPFFRTLRAHGLSAIGWGDRIEIGEIPQGSDLVAAVDGVGTKTILLGQTARLRTAGWDAVAMVVNDLLARGARPRFLCNAFLADRLREKETEVLEGFFDGARDVRAQVLAGDTAELPGLLREGTFEIVAIALGVHARRRALGPEGAQPGDVLLGLPSSGPHANGFSLIRTAIPPGGLEEDWDGTSAEECLLAPTRIYLSPIGDLLSYCEVHALAHITGGGFDNVKRIIPDGLEGRIDFGSWAVPPIFGFLQSEGNIPEEEMRRTFNLGIGMVLVVPPQEAERIRGERGDLVVVGEVVAP